MKRILGLILLTLVLCGCTAPRQEETTAPPVETTLPTTAPTEPAGIYLPFSDLEIQTGGTVRYFLPEEDCYGIRMMGNDVLAFSGAETTRLTRYAGNQLYAIASAQLNCWIDPEETSFQISGNGITYYNPNSREVVFLDNDLKEVRRIGMSADMVGKPVLSSNRMQVFYCTADAIRVFDTATGLDKLLKTISYREQSVENVLLNDTVLCCSLTDDRGTEYTIFLSTQTGGMVSQILSGVELSTQAERFYAKCPEGIQELLVFGQKGGDPQVLTPADPFAESWYLEEVHALVTATVTEETTVLDHYDLSTGLRTASVELPQRIVPICVEYRQETGEVLVRAFDFLEDAPVILSWNHDENQTEDATIYTGPRYTAEDPDLVGLDACGILVREISAKYGVKILISGDAVRQQPWDYSLEQEYQISVIKAQLEKLEGILSCFPEGFFRELNREPVICIVRSIRGNAESGSVDLAQGIQFWDGYDPYVVLAAGDTLEGAFYHEMFHVLDGMILSNTRAYYRWDNLNPEGVRYFGDYTSYLEADVSQYLTDENRVFIDAYSMCYSREDRARIMEYACQTGNEAYFQSETMQNKLKALCEGIRQAFKLEKSQESFLWEQYLKDPLTAK